MKCPPCMSAELRLYMTLKPLLIVLLVEQGYISRLLGRINLDKCWTLKRRAPTL